MAERSCRKFLGKPTKARAVGGCRCNPSTGTEVRPAETATLNRSTPVPSWPVSGRAALRRTPIGPFQDWRALSIFPPSPTPPQPETRTDPPRLRPTFRESPALPGTPFLLHPELWAASGFRAPPCGRRWEGTGRGGPNTPPERSREAGTGGKGGANLLGAALPWQRGRAEGEGGSELEGDVVLPRPPPQLPLPASCRVFPEAASGSCREQLRCSAILYLPLPVPRLPAVAAELTVSPGLSGVLPGRRSPASALPAPTRGYAPGR